MEKWKLYQIFMTFQISVFLLATTSLVCVKNQPLDIKLIDRYSEMSALVRLIPVEPASGLPGSILKFSFIDP